MKHCEDSQLLLAAGGEADADVNRHVSECQECRVRQAKLLATLETASDLMRTGAVHPGRNVSAPALAATAVVMVVGVAWMLSPTRGSADLPDARFTPGAVRVDFARAEACSGDDAAPVIPVSQAKVVFERYSIAKPGGRNYEVDYLIPPDLGGSASSDNLWPQPYSNGIWNSHIKDALEDRLRALVCSGEVDVRTAQREIASDWIRAYKKYFRTDRPMVDHAGFVKDRPWE